MNKIYLFLMLRPRQGAAEAASSSFKKKTEKDGSEGPKCQKCLKTGHWTFDCKNERATYKRRPTRTALLSNPALRLPEEDLAVRDLISKSSLTSDGAVKASSDGDDSEDSDEELSTSSDESSIDEDGQQDDDDDDDDHDDDDDNPSPHLSSSTISDQLSVVDSLSDSGESSGFSSSSSSSSSSDEEEEGMESESKRQKTAPLTTER